MSFEQCHDLMQQARFFALQAADDGMALLNLLDRCTPIQGQFSQACAGLLFEPPNTLHEELVQIGTYNGDEFKLFKKRCPLVLGFMQDAPVELQPGQFTIEIPAVIRKIDLCRTIAGFPCPVFSG